MNVTAITTNIRPIATQQNQKQRQQSFGVLKPLPKEVKDFIGELAKQPILEDVESFCKHLVEMRRRAAYNTLNDIEVRVKETVWGRALHFDIVHTQTEKRIEEVLEGQEDLTPKSMERRLYNAVERAHSSSADEIRETNTRRELLKLLEEPTSQEEPPKSLSFFSRVRQMFKNIFNRHN